MVPSIVVTFIEAFALPDLLFPLSIAICGLTGKMLSYPLCNSWSYSFDSSAITNPVSFIRCVVLLKYLNDTSAIPL
jgi:hypothetical protein